MAGHSKWANIKHKKAKEDAARGKAFTKLIKEITIVAKEGGGDPAGNPRLRTLIDKAKSINMPQNNIQRAIQKGTGELPGVSYEQCMYEGYGPGGMAVVVEVLTDNKNRAVAELRHMFSKKGGNLSESGSVSWMFEQKGVITCSAPDTTEDKILDLLIDYDVDDIEPVDDFFVITCAMQDLAQAKDALMNAGYAVEEANIEWIAKNKTELDEQMQQTALEFLDAIDELDDVQNIYSNL